MRLTRRMAAVLAAVAVVGGGAGVALAGGGPLGGGDRAGDLAAAINEQAGTSISAADVEAALAELRADRLAAEVAAGRLTQEQADRITAHEAFRQEAHTAIERAMADAIGVSVDRLAAARAAGTSPAELAEQEGVARSVVIAAVVAALDALSDDAPDGLRAAASDEALAQRAERIVDGVREHHDGPGGRHGGPGGPFGDHHHADRGGSMEGDDGTRDGGARNGAFPGAPAGAGPVIG